VNGFMAWGRAMVRSTTGRWSLAPGLLLTVACCVAPQAVLAQGDSQFQVSAPEPDPQAAVPVEAAPTDAEVLAAERRGQESFLAWILRSSGFFGFLILLSSFILIALIMMDFLQLRRSNYVPADFMEQFEQRVAARDLTGALELARGHDSFLARVLTAGLSRLTRSWEEAERGMQEVGESETMAMEHKIGYLALMASVTPMLGLLGTVQGMITSFSVIAAATTTPRHYQLADGIAMALVTTGEGLFVAIPAIVFFSIFRNRLARFVMECGFAADNLMSPIQQLVKAQAAATPAGRPPTASPARQS